MKIACVGGGPTGLYVAICMKLCSPEHEVTLFERNRPSSSSTQSNGGWCSIFQVARSTNVIWRVPPRARLSRANPVYRSAWAKDTGQERVTREASMAKLQTTERAQAVIDRAVQIFGGDGFVSGGPVERLYREIRPLRIYEGTSEIQKILLARKELRKSQQGSTYQ